MRKRIGIGLFEARPNRFEESRRTLAAWGVVSAAIAALGSFVVYELTKAQCSGASTESVAEALEGRNGVCRALGLPLAPGSGGHLLLVGVLAVPPAIALLGTVAAVRSRSFRPIVIAIGLCALTGFGLIVMGGNAGVRPIGLQP